MPVLFHRGSHLLCFGCCGAIFKGAQYFSWQHRLEITYASEVSRCQRGVKTRPAVAGILSCKLLHTYREEARVHN